MANILLLRNILDLSIPRNFFFIQFKQISYTQNIIHRFWVAIPKTVRNTVPETPNVSLWTHRSLVCTQETQKSNFFYSVREYEEKQSVCNRSHKTLQYGPQNMDDCVRNIIIFLKVIVITSLILFEHRLIHSAKIYEKRDLPRVH